jgi:hypothetical protein
VPPDVLNCPLFERAPDRSSIDDRLRKEPTMSGNTDGIEQEEEQQFGLPDFHVSQRADEPRPAPVAPEIREFLAALVLNTAACRHWLSADPPDIRQARATMERMTSDARALIRFIGTSGHDSHA